MIGRVFRLGAVQPMNKKESVAWPYSGHNLTLSKLLRFAMAGTCADRLGRVYYPDVI